MKILLLPLIVYYLLQHLLKICIAWNKHYTGKYALDKLLTSRDRFNKRITTEILKIIEYLPYKLVMSQVKRFQNKNSAFGNRQLL